MPLPDCEIKETSDYVDNYKPEAVICLAGARMKLMGDVYPFKCFPHFDDDSQSRLFP